MKKKIAIALLGLFLVAGLAGCGNKVPDDAVALVNDEVIVEADLEMAYEQFAEMYAYYGLDTSDVQIQAMIKETALNQLISQTLLIQEAKNRGLEVTEEEIQTEIDFYIEGYYETEENLIAQLESYGMTLDDLKTDITDSLLYDKLVQDLLTNLEADVLKASHILINAEKDASEEEVAAAKAKAMEVITELDNGADFAALAKVYSEDTGSAVDGGQLGYFVKNMMVEPFSEGAAALEVGTYTKEPVRSDFGFHIILLEDKKDGVKVMEENTDGQYDTIIAYENNYAIYDLEDELMANAEIEYLVDFVAEAEKQAQAENNAEAESETNAEGK